jgi:hypothetical protein
MFELNGGRKPRGRFRIALSANEFLILRQCCDVVPQLGFGWGKGPRVVSPPTIGDDSADAVDRYEGVDDGFVGDDLVLDTLPIGNILVDVGLTLGAQHIKVETLKCQRCGHRWVPRQATVTICPKCKSRLWDKPKRKPRA